MKKKFLALVLTLSMVLSLVPMTALATGDNQVDTVAAGETTNAGTNEGSQDSGSPTGGDNAGSGDSADTSEAPGANNKDEGKDSGSENTDETTPGSPSTPDTGSGAEGGNTGTGGTTEGSGTGGGAVTEPEKPEVLKYAAKIGDTEYETIAAAINAIQEGSSDNTITLLCDVKENIKINKSLTLDLGGYTLTGDGTKTVVAIAGKEIKVTVRNGTITGGKSTNGGGLDIQSGEILLEKCNITENNAANGGAINISGSANVQIKDSEIHDNTATNSGGAIYMASSYAID